MKIKFKKYWRKTSLKKKKDAYFLLNHIANFKPKNFLEIGVFHGVTSRNVCELLHSLHNGDFTFTGIDLFGKHKDISAEEYIPKTKFSNPLKNFYYYFIKKKDPYSFESVSELLKKFKKNVNLIKGDSNQVLQKININVFDYVFLDGGHKYETVKTDLECLIKIIENDGIIICDDYNLTYAPGVKKAIDEFTSNHKFDLKILNNRFAEITNKKNPY